MILWELSTDLKILAGFLVIAAIIFGFISIVGLQNRCPHCKKWSALKYNTRYKINERSISIKKKLEKRNSYGELISTQDAYILGTETTYEVEYVCKYCGKKCTKKKVEKTENV